MCENSDQIKPIFFTTEGPEGHLSCRKSYTNYVEYIKYKEAKNTKK